MNNVVEKTMERSHLSLVVAARHEPNRLDWATVEHELSRTGNGDDTRTLRLLRLILSKLFEILPQEADEYITDGGDDAGIDAFVIDYNNNQIHLISTKTVDAFDKARKNFPGAEVTKLICFVSDFVGRTDTLLTRCNPLLRAKIVEAWEAIDSGRVFHVCVHACSNQSGLVDRDFKTLREALAKFRASLFEHHLTQLSDEVTRNWAPPTSRGLRFIGHELFEHDDIDPELGSVKSLIGCVRASELVAFLRDERTGFIDEGLFHANVRGHLGVQNPVNREIAETLRGSRNSRFLCLNNGITVVCDKYLYQSGGFPVTLHRPQIVNGRQTAQTIYEAYREDPAHISEVVVFVRVVQTSDGSLIEDVSIATNSQSRIGSRDLRANSATAKKLAAGLAQLGYYYVRKRGEKSTCTPEKTIDALKAGQLILAYERGLPEKAKTDTASMFGDEFLQVFDPNQITPELVVTAHRLFLDIEAEKRRAMLTMRQSGLSAASVEHWLVEGAFHVLFCVGLIARRENLDLANYDVCRERINDAMATVGNYYEGVERIAAYRLFRSVKSRDDLRRIIGGGIELTSDSSDQLKFGF
jgi:AIPR protein